MRRICEYCRQPYKLTHQETIWLGNIDSTALDLSTDDLARIETEAGAATNIIEGLAVGMQSTAIPTIVVVLALGVSYWAAGLYGIALAGVGMLSTLGITLDAAQIPAIRSLPAKQAIAKLTQSFGAHTVNSTNRDAWGEVRSLLEADAAARRHVRELFAC